MGLIREKVSNELGSETILGWTSFLESCISDGNVTTARITWWDNRQLIELYCIFLLDRLITSI